MAELYFAILNVAVRGFHASQDLIVSELTTFGQGLSRVSWTHG